MACVIWGDEAEERRTAGDYREINSPRAGGWYRIVGSAEPAVANLSPIKKKALTQWLHKQHALGDPIPEIHTGNIDLATSLSPLRFTQQINAALLWLDKQGLRVGSILEIRRGGPDAIFSSFVGATDADSGKEGEALLQTLVSMGYLDNQGSTNTAYRFRITPKGWTRIDELSATTTNSSQVFVAMWFNPVTEEAFTDGIAPAILESGYDPVRIDKQEHLNKIDDQIIAEIRRSRFVVSDFTCEPGRVRGGVYYEAGFAGGLGIPVIWTCHAASADYLHFDTRQYNHIMWRDPPDLRQRLKARIGAVIGAGPLHRPSNRSAV